MIISKVFNVKIPLSSSMTFPEAKILTFPTSPPNASRYAASAETFQSEVQGQIEQSRAQISRAIAHPDASTLKALNQTNQRLQKQGKPPIDLAKTTQEVESILNKPGLSDNEKKKQIEALRKKLGLSEGEMKELFTQRLAKIYSAAAKSLQQYQKAKSEALKAELKQAEALYGKNSPQAQEIGKKLEALKSSLDPERQRYLERSNFYKSLYPSFWSKLGSFFKSLGQGFMKVLSFVKPFLTMIPVFGPLASMAVQGLETIIKAIKTKGRSLLGVGLDFLKSRIPLPDFMKI